MTKKAIPTELRGNLENARLHALAITRALDTLGYRPADLPPQLHALFELDADFAEALHVLEKPPKKLNVDAMLGDTERSLALWPKRVADFTAALAPDARQALARRVEAVAVTLEVKDAYRDLPGGNHRNR